jgi:hypothetical protein
MRTKPLLTSPDKPSVGKTFTDIDSRNTQTLQVSVTDTEAVFMIVGKRGSVKAALWISPDSARVLAAFLTEWLPA